MLLNYKNEIQASKCPKCDTPYISEDGNVSVNESKRVICGAILPENDILAIENYIRISLLLKEPSRFKLQNKNETLKGFLKKKISLKNNH